MTVPSFAERQRQWSHPPVDGVGYIASTELLAMSDDALRLLVERMERERYGGWRNWHGNWRRVLGLDSTVGKRVLDYGCGIGLEALQYAERGCEVDVADMSPDNAQVALRVLRLFSYPARMGYQILDQMPPLYVDEYDVIHCNGVLHHIPDPEPIVEWMSEHLTDDGELRLMVYSDEAWRIATGTEPPDDVLTSPHFERYWQTWDPHGGYADWYDRARLEARFGQWFDVAVCEYLTERREYLGAVLVKR